LLVGPLLSAVRRRRDVGFETRGDRFLRVARVEPEQGRQIEEVEELRALEERLRLLLPGLAAIARAEDLAELADDPAVLLIDELDVVEDGIGRGEALASRQVAFHLDLARAPRLAAVGGGRQDRAIADGPGVLRVGGVDVEEVRTLDGPVTLLERRVRLLLRPRLAAVRRGQDQAVLPHDPAPVVVDEVHAVEGDVDARWENRPVPAAVARLDDFATVADDDRAVLGERLDVIETIG